MGLEIKIDATNKTAQATFTCEIDMAHAMREETIHHVHYLDELICSRHNRDDAEHEIDRLVLQRLATQNDDDDTSEEQIREGYSVRVGDTRRVVADKEITAHAVRETQLALANTINAYNFTDEMLESELKEKQEELARYRSNRPSIVIS